MYSRLKTYSSEMGHSQYDSVHLTGAFLWQATSMGLVQMVASQCLK